MTNYLLTFYIYSILGYIVEIIYLTIIEKKISNRGFLIGPWCPIYGIGSVIIFLYLEQYKNNLLTLFILSIVITCFLEYITSWAMEKIFNARWWDYSNEKFNLNGRICGTNALLFGTGAIVLIYIVNPYINSIINKIDVNILNIITIIITIIFIIDTISSFNIINKLKKNFSNIEIKKDMTNEAKALVNSILNNNINEKKIKLSIFQKRIIKAFPNIDISKYLKVKRTKIKKLLKRK